MKIIQEDILNMWSKQIKFQNVEKRVLQTLTKSVEAENALSNFIHYFN